LLIAKPGCLEILGVETKIELSLPLKIIQLQRLQRAAAENRTYINNEQ